MNLTTALAESVRRLPQKTAIYWAETQVSYATLQEQTLAATGRLTGEFRVGPGDRVGLWLKNCPEFVPALFGVLGAGAVVVPINNFLKPDEVNFILADANVDVLITDPELAAHTPALKAVRPTLQVAIAHDLIQPAPARAGNESSRGESDLAVIIYTSGTTGRPKGAMLSHGNLLHNVESCRRVLATIEDDRFAVILPMFHSYMLTVGTFLPLLVGGSMVVVKSLHPPHLMLKELYLARPTVLPAIPQFYRMLAHAPLPAPLPFRLCISGAAPLPVQVLQDFEAKHRIPLIEGYGLSEASPVVTKNPINGVRKPGSIGLPIPNVEVSIQDDGGRMLAAGEIGEICVRGGNVMQGYWNLPAETAAAMRDGWLLTGDVGYRDADGYYFITDRKKDMLLVNGINVYPREIEEALHRFPGVKEAAVVGVADPRKGEHPVAFVAAGEGVQLEEKVLHHFLRDHLADYKLPRRIHLVANLPRNATGKILKTTLREMTKTKPDQIG